MINQNNLRADSTGFKSYGLSKQISIIAFGSKLTAMVDTKCQIPSIPTTLTFYWSTW